MVSNKLEKILVGINDKVVELTGDALDAFIADRKIIQTQLNAQAKTQAEAKELKVSAYTKLGLTPDEIAAIL